MKNKNTKLFQIPYDGFREKRLVYENEEVLEDFAAEEEAKEYKFENLTEKKLGEFLVDNNIFGQEREAFMGKFKAAKTPEEKKKFSEELRVKQLVEAEKNFYDSIDSIAAKVALKSYEADFKAVKSEFVDLFSKKAYMKYLPSPKKYQTQTVPSLGKSVKYTVTYLEDGGKKGLSFDSEDKDLAKFFKENGFDFLEIKLAEKTPKDFEETSAGQEKTAEGQENVSDKGKEKIEKFLGILGDDELMEMGLSPQKLKEQKDEKEMKKFLEIIEKRKQQGIEDFRQIVTKLWDQNKHEFFSIKREKGDIVRPNSPKMWNLRPELFIEKLEKEPNLRFLEHEDVAVQLEVPGRLHDLGKKTKDVEIAFVVIDGKTALRIKPIGTYDFEDEDDYKLYKYLEGLGFTPMHIQSPSIASRNREKYAAIEGRRFVRGQESITITSENVESESRHAEKLIKRLREVPGIGLTPGYPVMKNPNNPYRKALLEACNEQKVKYGAKIDYAIHVDNGLFVKYENGDAVTFKGDAYKAIFWNEIVARVKEGFRKVGYDKNLEESKISDYIKAKDTALNKFVDRLAMKMSAENAARQLTQNRELARKEFREAIKSVWKKPKSLKTLTGKANDFLKKLSKYESLKYLPNEEIRVDGLVVVKRARKGIDKKAESQFSVIFVRENGSAAIKFESNDSEVQDAFVSAKMAQSNIFSIDAPIDHEELNSRVDPFIQKHLYQPCIDEFGNIPTEVLNQKIANADSKSKAELEKMAFIKGKGLEEFNEKYNENHKDTLESLRSGRSMTKERLDDWLLIIRANKHRVDPATWNACGSDHERQRVMEDMMTLGIYKMFAPSFIEANFNQLRKANDETFINKLTDKTVEKMYKNPEHHLDELAKKDPLFHQSYMWYRAFKETTTTLMEKLAASEEKLTNGGGVAGAMDTFVDIAGGQWENIKRAAREGNIPLLLCYGLLGGGLIHLIKNRLGKEDSILKKTIFGGEKGWTWGDAGALGIVAVMVNAVSGNKIFEKLGFSDSIGSIAGTVMNNPLKIIKQHGNKKEQDVVKNLDGNVYAQARHIPLRKLMHAYKNSTAGNSVVPHFIDPTQFHPFDTQFLRTADYYLEKNNGLFKHVGEQLFLVAQALDISYQLSWKADEKSYYENKDLLAALERGDIDASTVIEFATSLNTYIVGSQETTLRSLLGKEKERGDIFEKAVGKNISSGAKLDEIDGYGENAFEASVQGYPMIITIDEADGKCYIFDRLSLKKRGAKPSKQDNALLGSFALDGTDVGNAKALENAIKSAVENLIKSRGDVPNEYLIDQGKMRLDTNGNWVFDVIIPAMSPYIMEDRTELGKISFHKNLEGGKAYDLVIGNEVIGLSGDGKLEEGAETARWVPVLKDLLKQTGATTGPAFSALSIFSLDDMKMRKRDDIKDNPHVFSISVGGFEFDVVYVPANAGITPGGAPASNEAFFDLYGDWTEDKIVRDPKFRKAYVDAVKKNYSFERAFKAVNKVIDKADDNEKHLAFGFDSFIQMFKDIDFHTDWVSGTVPREYAVNEVDVMKAYLIGTLSRDIANSDDLASINNVYDNFMKSKLYPIENFSPDASSRGLFMNNFEALRGNLGLSSAAKGVLRKIELESYDQYGKGNDLVFKESHAKIANNKRIFIEKFAQYDNPLLGKLPYPYGSRTVDLFSGNFASSSPKANGWQYSRSVVGPHRTGDFRRAYDTGTGKATKSPEKYEVYLDNKWMPVKELYVRNAWALDLAEDIINGAKVESLESFKSSSLNNLTRPIDFHNNEAPLKHDPDHRKTRPAISRIGLTVDTVERTELEEELEKQMVDMAFKIITEGGSVIKGREPKPDVIKNHIKTWIKNDLKKDCKEIAENYSFNRADQIAEMKRKVEGKKTRILKNDRYWDGLSWKDRMWVLYAKIVY